MAAAKAADLGCPLPALVSGDQGTLGMPVLRGPGARSCRAFLSPATRKRDKNASLGCPHLPGPGDTPGFSLQLMKANPDPIILVMFDYAAYPPVWFESPGRSNAVAEASFPKTY
jgi:hypothetical protein